MNIYFSEAPHVPPTDSDLLAQVKKAGSEFDLTVVSEPHQTDFADAAPKIKQADGMIANFARPDDVLRQKVLFAHAMGKSVLVGMGYSLNPVEVLSEIAKPPYQSFPRRENRVYYVTNEAEPMHAIKIQRTGLSQQQLRLWLFTKHYELSVSKGSPLTDEPFVIEDAAHKRHGAEADQLPLFDD